MPSVSSTSNPTNLKSIARKHIELERSESGGRAFFKLTRLDLEAYELDGDEQVFVVARAGNTSRRFEMGLVGRWTNELHDLSGLDASNVCRFRVLIRKPDAARLLATAENLRCKGDGDMESLLPIVSTELGQRAWRVVIGEDGAVLQCNKSVFPTGGSAENFPPFRALVLPEALRQVLEYLARDPGRLEVEGTVWSEWATWMGKMGIELPPKDEEQRDSWLTESTGRFCDHFRSVDDLQQSLQQGDSA